MEEEIRDLVENDFIFTIFIFKKRDRLKHIKIQFGNFLAEKDMSILRLKRNHYQQKGQQLYINLQLKYPTKIQVCGIICQFGTITLKIFEGNIDGTIYKKIIEKELITTPQILFGNQKWMLIKDNEPNHICKIANELRKNLRITRLEESPSSVLIQNLMLNIWLWLKIKLEKYSMFTQQFNSVLEIFIEENEYISNKYVQNFTKFDKKQDLLESEQHLQIQNNDKVIIQYVQKLINNIQNHNNIDTYGAQHVGKTFSQLQNLNILFLYLNDCKIQDEGAISISQSRKKFLGHMIFLFQKKQCIDINGVQNIAKPIEKFEKIKDLGFNFQESNLSQETARLIAIILQDFHNLSQLELNLEKCPIHKRLIMYLRTDNTEDPQVIKCQKCIDENKQQRFIDIGELLQSDDHFLFQKWPIHDDDTILGNLKKIKQWTFAQHCEEINFIFDEIVEKIQLKRKEILKDLGQIQEDQQKPLNYYKQISQQENLADIIKSQFGDQKKQNEMILNIIKENEQNYESNKKQLIDLINQANKHLFDLTKVKNMKDEVLSLISMLKIFDNQQDNSKIEQIDNISVDENNQNFEEITINQFDDLDECYDFKIINIDLIKYKFKVQDLEEIQNTFLKCKNIIELQLDLKETDIGDEAIKYIKNGLAKHQNITSLELMLENNQITELGAKYLANSIEYIQNLICLSIDLSYNNIDAGGAQHIAKALSQLQNLNLLFLYLNYCQIKDEGAICISESIKKLKYISSIFIGLRKSGISFKGVQNVANSIDNFEKIKYLGLNFQKNNIGNEGISYLAQKLQNFQNLKTLDLFLGGNKIDDSGAQSLLQSIQNYKNIVNLKIFLWESNLSIETARFIAKILQDFHKLSDLELNLEM
ncbi:hypothetical protein ABPG74_013063 [Tetrahymena malaccensis]